MKQQQNGSRLTFHKCNHPVDTEVAPMFYINAHDSV